MMLDLEPKYLEMVHRVLAFHVPDVEVRVFGSRVQGKAVKFSDLDLALVAKDPIPNSRLENIRDAFAASDLPIMVDVLDWNSIAESFRRVIEKNYEVLRPGGNPASDSLPPLASALPAQPTSSRTRAE